MRHLWSLLAGVVIAPLGWAAVAYGQAVMKDLTAGGSLAGHTSTLALAGTAFVGVGVVVGLIACLRISPVGPLVVALFYLGSTALLVFAPKTGLDAFDRVRNGLFGYDVSLLGPLTSGVIAVLGGVLLMAVFSGSRWRGKQDPDETASSSSDWTSSTSSTGTFADLVSSGAGNTSTWGGTR
ncbi:hypothetical protein HDA40_007836 [Hamadaea flava]|uniref:Uncharacterized protein n=1 Tax=Hamadaea flava TaxID=1742688 RepID=A0ABV8LWA1_9ACTN|nr:hypothetical protein [Hamadaea flava]MCP2329329.1 hypothetical protein [Hamadaea flava]